MTSPQAAAPTLELLSWIDARPRTYRETIEAWRTSCPRLSVWEDAVGDGLVEVTRAAGGDGALVRVAAPGRAALEARTPGAVAPR